MSGAGWLLRRLLAAALLIWAAASLVFLLAQAAPGDLLASLGGDHQSEASRAALSEALALDRSPSERYRDWLLQLSRGDLGRAASHGRPVIEVLAERLPVSLAIALPALVLATALGLAWALVAGAHPGWARAGTALALVCGAAPVFWLAFALVQWFSIQLGWLPIQGLEDARSQASGWALTLERARHLVLPVSAVALHQFGLFFLMARAHLSLEWRQDHCRTALAKGHGHGAALVRHALPAAAAPLIALLGHRIGHLLTATALVEVCFGLPGMGRLLIDATLARDHVLVLGAFLSIVALAVLGNLLADLVSRRLDPRLSLGGGIE